MTINQGEIWLVNFDPSIGSEIQKKRPCVVVSDDRIGRFGIKIVAPITEWKDYLSDFPWIIKLSTASGFGLTKDSGIECFQVKSFSEDRFLRKIGLIPNNLLREVHLTILKTLDPAYKIK